MLYSLNLVTVIKLLVLHVIVILFKGNVLCLSGGHKENHVILQLEKPINF